MENTLTGQLLQRTQAKNGTIGGTFRVLGGVHTVERRQRLLAGLIHSATKVAGVVPGAGIGTVLSKATSAS